MAVFGILERAGKVYTVVPDGLKAKTLMPIIRQKVVPDPIVYTDGFGGHDALDVSEFRYERIDHDRGLVDEKGKQINGIENFWSQAKRVLRKYNGIPRPSFELFLMERDSRFNYGSPKQQLRLLKRWLRKEGVT
ncbi:ISXO2-like transposase domain protein [Calidithermus terrae]|uniref:ISXO2-like transposase domain protein n=1 Tax=Calidithermus terrae TaxID=1408545 RepID=A0A399EGF0_9DEIN|nr:ISXO2-like transposase domain protein [Calidithermus terrae]